MEMKDKKERKDILLWRAIVNETLDRQLVKATYSNT